MSNQNKTLYETQTADGALNHSRKMVDDNTGSCGEEAGKIGRPDTSEAGSGLQISTLPNWLATNPEILAGQMRDILALMQQAGWFTYVVEVESRNGRTALRVTVSPPKAHKISITGRITSPVINIDGQPV